MNNVINLKARQHLKLRSWANAAAMGTTLAVIGYVILLSFWPEFFLHWLAGLIVGLAALIANGTALVLYVQRVRAERERERQIRQWREEQAAERRRARAQEAAQLRQAMEAPTQILRILPPVAPDPTTYDREDRMRMRLWTHLTERTGDLGEYRSERPTPPHGWRSGVA